MHYKITNKAIDKLKYDLVREGLLDYNQLVDSIEHSREQQTNLGQVLIQNNIINEESLLNFLEKKLHIPYVNLDDYTIDTNTIALISENEVKKYKIIPLFLIEDTLTIAMADPLDLFALNNINIDPNYKVEPVICSERSILNAIDDLYSDHTEEVSTDKDKCPPVDAVVKHQFDWQSELNEDKTNEVNIYRLVKAIIYQAINEKASDIHFDPQQDELAIRFRIDGSLYSRGNLPILLSSGCTSRIKSAAGLDLNEETIAQSGRMEIDIEKHTLNARVSTYPTNYGEKLVIKVFSKAPNLDSLGLEANQLELLKNALSKESGMIIASGPLGSHQASIMYSLLEHINSEHKNIMTIESPIRYNIDKINQSQINNLKRFDIDSLLRSLLLQDPDIIYIDEITTQSDLELIVKAALGDQLIITSLMADSAIGALYRMIKLGIDPRLVNASVNATFSYKNLRTLCSHCKVEDNTDSKIKKQLKLSEKAPLFKAQGCSYCSNIGYKGTTGIFEIIPLDENTLKPLLDGLTTSEFINFLNQTSYKSLLDSALKKVTSGITSIDEVKKVIKNINHV